jgi:cytochrome P450
VVPGKSVQIDYEFEALTSKIALKTLFDLEDAGDRQRFSGTLKLAFELMNVRLRRIFKLPLWVPTPANLRLREAVGELDRTVEGFIASGRSRRDVGDDLLSRLLVAQHEDGTRMSDLQLRDEAMTLYLAGNWDRWQPASVCRKAIGKIALGDDAFDRVPVSAHDQGTNLLRTHLP